MGKLIDLTGKTFGRLTVLHISRRDGRGTIHWALICSCGNKTEAIAGDLKTGKTKSCGCLRHEVVKELHKKHGHKAGGKTSRVYTAWRNMHDRCYNPKDVGYSNYGGRGITVCDRWHDFQNFLADMGEPEPGLSLDRADNSKGYYKDNCRWATKTEQTRNQRSNVLITYQGKTQPRSAWAEEVGIGYSCLRRRLDNGWSVERALTTPTRKLSNRRV